MLRFVVHFCPVVVDLWSACGPVVIRVASKVVVRCGSLRVLWFVKVNLVAFVLVDGLFNSSRADTHQGT